MARKPGPNNVTHSNLSSLYESFSSSESNRSTTGVSFISDTDEDDCSMSYFDLGLGENGIGIGHLNVDNSQV